MIETEVTDLTARCFCHEIEHLDGHLFDEHIDHFMTDEDFEAYYAAHEEELAAMAEEYAEEADGAQDGEEDA